MGNTTLHTDDFFYQYMPGPDDNTSMWVHKGDMITSFSQIPKAVYNHRLNVNGRLSNAAYLSVQPLPEWTVRYFCGIAIAFLAWLLWRWCGRQSLRNNSLAIAIPLLLWMALQWHNQMQSADFQFNYTIPSVLLIGCMMFFFQREKSPGVGGWLLLAVFSVWHESFSLLFAVFLGIQWLFRRDKRTFIAIVVLVAGCLFQFSHGSQERLDGNLYYAGDSLSYIPWSKSITSSWLTLATLIWWIVRRKKVSRNIRRKLDRFGIGLSALFLVSLSLIVVVAAPQRAHWAMDVIAILFALNIIRTYKPVNIASWLKITLLTLYVAWGCSLIYWQIRVTKFTNYTIDEIKKDNVLIVDRDGISNAQIPFWLLEMTHLQYSPFDPWEYCTLPNVISNTKHSGYFIISEELEGKSFEEWPRYEGKGDFRNSGSPIIARRHDGRDFIGKQLEITFGKPTINTSPVSYLLGTIKSQGHKTLKIRLRVFAQNSVVAGNDTIDVLGIETLPRSLKGRPITGVSEI